MWNFPESSAPIIQLHMIWIVDLQDWHPFPHNIVPAAFHFSSRFLHRPSPSPGENIVLAYMWKSLTIDLLRQGKILLRSSYNFKGKNVRMLGIFEMWAVKRISRIFYLRWEDDWWAELSEPLHCTGSPLLCEGRLRWCHCRQQQSASVTNFLVHYSCHKDQLGSVTLCDSVRTGQNRTIQRKKEKISFVERLPTCLLFFIPSNCVPGHPQACRCRKRGCLGRWWDLAASLSSPRLPKVDLIVKKEILVWLLKKRE